MMRISGFTARAAVAIPLGDADMRVGVGRDLGQVRDAQDLVATGEAPQAAPERIGAPPADTGIDLVEDERRGRIGLGEDALDGERDARQLATGGDLGQWSRRLAGVGRQAVDDLIDARRIEGHGVAIDLDGGFGRLGRSTPDDGLEHAGREAKLDEHSVDRRRERGRGAQTGCR